MVIDFTFNEQYFKTYTPEVMKTEVFDLYFGGFGGRKENNLTIYEIDKIYSFISCFSI